MNFYGIKSEAAKIDGGLHNLSAYFHQRHFYRKWGKTWTTLCYGYNGNDDPQNLECPLFHMLKYMKSDFICS